MIKDITPDNLYKNNNNTIRINCICMKDKWLLLSAQTIIDVFRILDCFESYDSLKKIILIHNYYF